MLILGLKYSDAIILFDTETNRELGKINRIRSRDFNSDNVNVGFDFLPSIKIVRERALSGRDAGNENK